MNYKDYIKWAEEYREQADILDRKLAEKKEPRRFATAMERSEFESSVRILYGMKLDCLKTMAILEDRARSIKERELCEN